MTAVLKEVFVTDQKKPAVESLGNVSLYDGRAQGRLVREADPDGNTTVHMRNDTQREIDRLYHKGQISFDQHTAGTIIRDQWDAAGLGPSRVSAVNLDMLSTGRPGISDYVAWESYSMAMKQIHRTHRQIISDVVIHDMDLQAWGRRWRCAGLETLKSALDQLAKHYERVGR